MMSRWFSTGLALMVSLAIAACSGGPDSTSAPADPSPPNTVRIQPAERIVALTSLTADLVQTLDGERLVGITGSPLLQQDDRFAGLTTVSQGRVEPDLEQIVALEPDLVVGAAGFHDKTLQRLGELGVSTLTTEVNSWHDLRSLTETLAAVTAADPQPILNRYDACLSQAPDDAPDALLLVSRQPLLTPNKESWAGDFLAQFNVRNLAADLQGQSPFGGYVTLSAEKVLEANPSVLLVVDAGENLLDQLKSEPFWNDLQATQNSQVYEFDYFGLINPGSLDSIERACSHLAELK
ncbi:MAG: ABC transporter substrate-binding protein [Synechococcales bacterium]|nr:ABC transporter substrate-binding protein [Synechococcales bacterium]